MADSVLRKEVQQEDVATKFETILYFLQAWILR